MNQEVARAPLLAAVGGTHFQRRGGPGSVEGRVGTGAARRWPGAGPVVGFFALAFGLSWGVGAVFKGVPIVAPDGLFIGGVSLAAVIVVAATEGRAGLGDLGHRLVR